MSTFLPKAFVGVMLLAVLRLPGAETFDDALRRAEGTYTERQQQAAQALITLRDRVAAEKTPLLQQIRAAEDRIIQAQTDQRRTEIAQEQSANDRRKLVREIDELAKTTTYANTLSHDALKALRDQPTPGDAAALTERIDTLLAQLEKAPPGQRAQAAANGAEFLLGQVQQALGGRRIPGSALSARDNQLQTGTFVVVGPETFFRSDDAAQFGSVRLRDGSPFPTVYPIPSWQADDARAFFTGQIGAVPLDSSGGKALRLAETKGSIWEHIKKGGVVAFAIIAAGLLALIMIVQKATELAGMGAGADENVRRALLALAKNDDVTANESVARLRGSMRALFAAGLEQREAPKVVCEEVLQSVLLEQRLRYERRLPLLAVIATASPLMGLLGTVVGMVRTFALITVFGTGNAGKLSSGISEVLVATELGLMVAIPTLIAHGFLAHRVHKNLATLEKTALQLVTAIDAARAERGSSMLVK